MVSIHSFTSYIVSVEFAGISVHKACTYYYQNRDYLVVCDAATGLGHVLYTVPRRVVDRVSAQYEKVVA